MTPSAPSARRLIPAAAMLWAAGLALPAAAQDSVATAAGGNDALSPYEPTHQRRTYVVDLTPVATSWGRRVAVGPVMKASRILTPAGGVTPPTNLLGSTAVSPGVLGPVPNSRTFARWAAAGQGAHPTLNAPPAFSEAPATFDRQFCVGITDFAPQGSGSVPTNISGAIVGQDSTNRRRLYVERTYALISRAEPNAEDTATLALGAVDPSGNAYARADDFLSLFPNVKINGENVARVSLFQRDVNPASAFALNFLLKDLLGPSNQSWDSASTAVLLNNTGVPLACPVAAAQALLPGQPPLFGNMVSLDLSGAFRSGSSAGTLTQLTGALAPGVVGLRGNPSFSFSSASLNGLPALVAPAALAGTIASLATTGTGTAQQQSLAAINSINVFGAQFAVPGAAPTVVPGSPRRATLPSPITSDSGASPAFSANSSGSARFTHGLDQVPFRGPSGQVGIGQLGVGGDLIVAATAVDSPGEFVCVKRFVAGDAATDNWTVAAYPGQPVLDGPNGVSIGALVGGSPAAISSPAVDLLGNVYFVARWQPTASATRTGLFKANVSQVAQGVGLPTHLVYSLELLLSTGAVIAGANSATNYTITALRLADADSIASGAFHAGQIIQSQQNAPGQSAPTANPSKIHAFGGAVVNATIEYAAPGAPQRYEAALFVGPFKSLVGDVNDDGVCDFIDLNIVLGEFGMAAPGLLGDADGDGDCDFTDLNFVLDNFGDAEPS